VIHITALRDHLVSMILGRGRVEAMDRAGGETGDDRG